MPPSEPNARASAPALWLGLAGLLPFLAGALLALFGAEPFWLAALVAWGAVILSFVGALHWGYAVRDGASGADGWLRYGWSVTPALLAWACLLLPARAGALALAAALVLALLVDHALAPRLGVPRWFASLRRLLTAVAAASLLAAGLAGG